MGKQKAYFICVAIALVVKMTSNFILIPKIDYLAGCWATILSDFCHYWICAVLLKKIGFPIQTVRLILIPALGSLVSALCLLPSRGSSSILPSIPFIGLAIVVYIGVIIFFKYIGKEEMLSLIRSKVNGQEGRV